MTDFRKFRPVLAAFGVIAVLGLTGCGEEGPAEKAGKKVDQAADQAGKKLDEMKKQMQGK